MRCQLGGSDGEEEDAMDFALSLKAEDHALEHKPAFPAGLRLLVVDDDPLCLKVVEQMLRRCSYEVTVCSNATQALATLRDKHSDYDMVLSDVYMPDMDGFRLLELVGLEMDLPVIMMSSNGDTSNVLRGVTHGACDYLIKPVRLEELRNLWQHVVRRRRLHAQELDSDEQSQERDEDQVRNKRKAEGVAGDQCRANGGGNGLVGAASGGMLDEMGLDNGSNKKARVVWSVEMHQQFVNAVNQLGIDKAVPKKILEIMNVDGLTRENVASHLQKYRLYLKRVSGVQASGQPRSNKPSPPPPQMQQPQHQPQQPGTGPSGGAAGGGGQGQGATGAGAGPGGPVTGTGAIASGPQGEGAAAAAAALNAMGVASGGGGFTGHGPPHPVALLAANPMAAAVAGLNPLLTAMGSLGVGAMSPLGPVGPLGPLNGMQMPGMQPQLGLLSGLPGGGGQPGMGPLGPLGLGGLPGMHGGLPLNPMTANGLQQMAAANLMQGMAAGMGQLPAMAMNGLLGGMPGMGMGHGNIFQQAAAAAAQQHHQQQQHHHHQEQQQQAAIAQQNLMHQQVAAAAVAAAHHQQQQQHQQQHASNSIKQEQLLQHQLQPHLPHGGSISSSTGHLPSPSPSPHAPVPAPHLAPQPFQPSNPHLSLSPSSLLASGMPSGPDAIASVGIIDQQQHQHQRGGGGGAGGGRGSLDLPADLMSMALLEGFPAMAGGGGGGGGGSASHAVVPNLDPGMLLDGDDTADIAAVFTEMYGAVNSGPGGGHLNSAAAACLGSGGGGGVMAGGGGGGCGADSGLGDPTKMVVTDDDFFNFLLKN